MQGLNQVMLSKPFFFLGKFNTYLLISSDCRKTKVSRA